MRPSPELPLWISETLHRAGHLAGTQGRPVECTGGRFVTQTLTYLLMGKANLESRSRKVLELENGDRMGKCGGHGGRGTEREMGGGT